MTPDEVRTLDNDYAILFIRGEKPVIDKKYDILKHPNQRERNRLQAHPPPSLILFMVWHSFC